MSDPRTLVEGAAGLRSRTSSAPATLAYGASKAVTTAGTAEQIHADTACRSVYIRAKDANTGNVYVGTSNVDSTIKLRALAAGEAWELSVYNVNQLYLDVDTNGEGIDYWITN